MNSVFLLPYDTRLYALALLDLQHCTSELLQVRLREPEAFQLDDVRAISFAEVAERARALQVQRTAWLWM